MSDNKATVTCVACGEPQERVGREWPTCRVVRVTSRVIPPGLGNLPANMGFDRPALSTVTFDALQCVSCATAWQEIMTTRQAEYAAHFAVPVTG